jgi:hypothetical protein
VIVADAGMLSAINLRELDKAGLRFMVGSRTTKAPQDLEAPLSLPGHRVHRWTGDRHDHLARPARRRGEKQRSAAG